MSTTIFEDDLTLPGVITNILNDYNAEYDQSQFGTTQSVTIIGTAFDGPVGVPTPISVPEQAKYIFGDSYDARTRREATLIPEIYDCWNKGCRSIYALRISGKDIYKDYELAVETDLRLRVRGAFPSNKNKEICMIYDTQQNPANNAGTIKILKHATRATINEKKLGLVDDPNAVLVKEINLPAFDFTKESKLIDVINKVNSNQNNNVLYLEIVNSEGVAVNNSKEAQDLSLGAMFPGIYTIGREKTNPNVVPSTNVEFKDASAKPYEGFNGFIWKKLNYNTDVAQPYPIFAETSHDMNRFFGSNSGLFADAEYKYMKDPMALDKLTIADKIDYEEVDIDPFEMYKKLGSGFCSTCMVEKIKDKEENYHYRVIQTPETNPNKVIGIQDGLYSILENHATDYLVLSCANAETSLYGGIPKLSEFKKTTPNDLELIALDEGGTPKEEDPLFSVQTKVKEKDFSVPVKYEMDIKNIPSLKQEEITTKLKKEIKYLRIPVIDQTKLVGNYEIEDNSMALAMDCSKIFTNGDLNGTEGVAEAPEYGDHVAPVCHGILVKYNKTKKAFEKIKIGYIPNEKINLIVDLNIDGKDQLVPFKFDLKESTKTANAEKEEVVYSVDYGEGSLEIGDYVIGSTNKNALIYKAEDKLKLIPIISLIEFSEGYNEDEFTVVAAESGVPHLPAETPAVVLGQEAPNQVSNNNCYIVVNTNEGSWLSNIDMVEKLNRHPYLKDKFTFQMVDNAKAIDEFPEHGLKASGFNKGADSYDTSLYLPYTTKDNFVRQLAQHCTYATLKGSPCHGVIGAEKISAVTLSNIADKVNKIMDLDLELFAKKPNGNNMLDKDNMPYSIGQNVSMTTMQYTVTTGNNYTYITNGAAGYAGMVSTLEPDSTSTNQNININNPAYVLSDYQISRLTKKGIITTRNSATKGTVVTDGVTLAPINSSYRRLSTTRIMNYISKLLKIAVEPYIGKIDNLATKNSINTAVKSIMNKQVGTIINKYDFKVVSTAAEQKLGIIKIHYSIVPFNEIRQIYNTIEISN